MRCRRSSPPCQVSRRHSPRSGSPLLAGAASPEPRAWLSTRRRPARPLAPPHPPLRLTSEQPLAAARLPSAARPRLMRSGSRSRPRPARFPAHPAILPCRTRRQRGAGIERCHAGTRKAPAPRRSRGLASRLGRQGPQARPARALHPQGPSPILTHFPILRRSSARACHEVAEACPGAAARNLMYP